ncbi:MAG: aminomethyl transferase family protein [Chloroflexi bacterium]|nr:aminomethyl transferase family protein [Chloroflexota bacterium]
MLASQHAAAGATFAQFQGVPTVSEYRSGFSNEYRAAKEFVGLMDRSWMGRVQLSGQDRFDFLNRMSTNDLIRAEFGTGLQTVLTTPEARIIDLLTVYAEAGFLLCVTSPQNRRKVLDEFRRKIFFRDRVKPIDVTDQTAQFLLLGPRAMEVLERLGGAGFVPLPDFHFREICVAGRKLLIARVPHIAGGGFDVIGEDKDAAFLWQVLLEAGAGSGLQPIGTYAYNILRIEASLPLYGYELSDAVNPLEAQLRQAISFSKGCYTGQEVIARLDTYQKLKQQLVGLRLSSPLVSVPPLPLYVNGIEVGQLTSVAQRPDTLDVIGLGYIRTKWNQPGSRVTIHAGEDEVAAIVADLPFETSGEQRSPTESGREENTRV